MGLHFVNDEYRFNMITNAKCGCTTLKNWYSAVIQKFKSYHESCVNNHGTIHDNPVIKAHVTRMNPEYFTFIVHRDPYARVVSCYYDKLANPSNPIYYIPGLSLSEFVARLKCPTYLRSDEHWYPQYRYLKKCGGLLLPEAPFPIDLKEVATGIELVSLELGIPNIPITLVPGQKVRSNHVDMLTEEDIRIINNVYHQDFEYFGYDKLLT